MPFRKLQGSLRSRLKGCPYDPNKRERNNKTLLHLAAAKGDIRTIKRLLTQGIDVNIQDNYGKTPLMTAIESHKPEAVETLLDNGADSYITDKNGNTALYLAVDSFQLQLVPRILSHRVNESIRAGEKKTGHHMISIIDSSELPVSDIFYSTKKSLQEYIGVSVKDCRDNLSDIEERLNILTLYDSEPQNESTNKEGFGSSPKSKRAAGGKHLNSECSKTPENFDERLSPIEQIISLHEEKIEIEDITPDQKDQQSSKEKDSKPSQKLRESPDHEYDSSTTSKSIGNSMGFPLDEKEEFDALRYQMNNILETMKISTNHIESMKGNFRRSEQMISEWDLIREHLKSLLEERERLTKQNEEYRSTITRLRRKVHLSPSLGEVEICRDHPNDRTQGRNVTYPSYKLCPSRSRSLSEPKDSERHKIRDLNKVTSELSLASLLKECQLLLQKQNSFNNVGKKHLEEECARIDNDMLILENRLNEMKGAKGILDKKLRSMRKMEKEINTMSNKVKKLQNYILSPVNK